jgi:thioredoxin-like negative regulator of GroEL
MSGLLFLTSDDFTVTKGQKGNILTNSIPGFSLILFYSTQCIHCKTLIPIFKKLPGTIGGCQFGMVNVSTNKRCVYMSKNTIAPIEYVPYIVLCIQGKPFMKYNGPHDSNEIRRFVIEVANKVQSKQQFTNEHIKTVEKGIPEYCIGKPLCGSNDKICYLEFDEAYKNVDN